MKSSYSISILHVIFLSMTVIGLKNHVTIIPPLLKTAGRDSWISVLLSTMTLLPWLFLWIYIQRKSNQRPIKEWLKEKVGNGFSKIILYGAAFCFLLLAALTMREVLQWIHTTFLPETPRFLMLIIYTVLCTLLITTNIQTIAIMNAFVLFWVSLFGFFVAFTNIQVKDYGLLRPFFEDGFPPVLHGMVYPASGFIEILLFIFLQHKIKNRVRWVHLAIMLLIITGLTMGPLVGAIAEFGPDEAAKQKYTAYEEWRLVTIGHYVEHVDFLSIYQWLTGAFIRVGLFLYVVVDIFGLTGNKKKIWKVITPLFFIICSALFFIRDDKFLALEKNYLLAATFIFFFLLSIVLTIIAAYSKNSTKQTPTKTSQMESGE